jgi:hypothetical protein
MKTADNDITHAIEPKIMPTKAPVLMSDFEEVLVPATTLKSMRTIIF